MKWTVLMVMITVVVATNSALDAQSKTIPGDVETLTATVEAIDATTRTLTVTGPKGNLVPITVPKSVERFTAAPQRTITATIVAIDNSAPSTTFKGEKVNWSYSSRVADKAALAKVKVGDRVDITWTEALMVSATPAKKD
jgi:Cu/Ag efflux protein CusF